MQHNRVCCMPKFTHIEVTPADIKRADPKKSGRCVVATAIARAIPDASRIEVDVQTVRFTRGQERFVYVTPYQVTGYVVAFDAGEEIHPFTFRLNETVRVPMKSRGYTEAGKALKRAKVKTQRAAAKVAALESVAADPAQRSPSRAVRQEAHRGLEDARTEAEAVTAAYADQTKQPIVTDGVRMPPRRVFKTSSREYGHRRLAINGGRATGVTANEANRD